MHAAPAADAGRVADFGSSVAEMAACRARVGVATRHDLAAELVAPDASAVPAMRRLAPGSWVVADDDSGVVIRPVAPGDEGAASASGAVVLSIMGPRLRQLLRICGASVPPVRVAFRTTIGTLPAWVLMEEQQHALVVLASSDAAACRRALEASGAPLGCVFVGQTALHRLAAAHLVSLA